MVKCRRHGYKALATQNIPAIKAPQRLDGHRFSVSTLKCLQRPISTVAPFHPLSFQASRCTHRSMQPFAAAREYSPTHDRNPIETALKNNCCIVTRQKTVRGCATTTKLKIQHIRCMFHGKCERNPTSILISKQFKTIGFARKMHAITGFFEKSVVSILHHSWIPVVRDQNSVSLIQLLPSPKRAARMLQLSSLLQHLGAAVEGCSLGMGWGRCTEVFTEVFAQLICLMRRLVFFNVSYITFNAISEPKKIAVHRFSNVPGTWCHLFSAARQPSSTMAWHHCSATWKIVGTDFFLLNEAVNHVGHINSIS